jgi:hypothetical protein
MSDSNDEVCAMSRTSTGKQSLCWGTLAQCSNQQCGCTSAFAQVNEMDMTSLTGSDPAIA